MNKINIVCIAILIAYTLIGCNTKFNASITTPISISVDGNTYLKHKQSNAKINSEGLKFTSGDSASLYFKTPSVGVLNIALVSDSASIGSKVSVNIAGEIISKELVGDTTFIGKFNIKDPGYLDVALTTDKDASIKYLLVGGDAAKGDLTYVKDFSTYWGRRGPSVHLKYIMPKESEKKDIQWFYNEVTVPEGEDVMHSYFMANGFGEGYFGMQVNSDTERRVLFSVWSPFETQDPNRIPDNQKIKLLRKGEDVHVGEFGNEGSGGQSYLRYMWKAGNTYRFLNEVCPDGKGNTIYTAYFFATDENRWRLIASFLRPMTNTYYKGAHSFLENFSPEGGYKSRLVKFANAWFITPDKDEWIYANKTQFTHDATASAGVRKDYDGGVYSDGSFYLKNCGFFNESTKYGTEFFTEKTGTQPDIDFDQLKKL